MGGGKMNIFIVQKSSCVYEDSGDVERVFSNLDKAREYVSSKIEYSYSNDDDCWVHNKYDFMVIFIHEFTVDQPSPPEGERG